MATVFETANEDALDAEFTVVASPQRLIVFTVTDSQIAELKSRAELVDFSTKAGYADGVKVIAVSRGGRGEVKRTIAALNEDAKTWIAQVKAKGGQIEQCLFDIEEPLKALKQKVDDEAEAAKAAAEAARLNAIGHRMETFASLEYSINPFLVAEMTDQEYHDEIEIASVRFRDILVARVAVIAAEAAKLEAMRLRKERTGTAIVRRNRFVKLCGLF